MCEWAEAADRIAPPPAYSLLTGDPTEEIVRFAGEGRCDLLVMGASSQPWRAPKSPGSIASGVVLEAPCSVMIAQSRRPHTGRRTG
jgi:nucleotide-binding universal stress UspA family protein